MKTFRHLWFAPSVDGERAALYQKLKKCKLPKTVSLVTVPPSGPNLIEIYEGSVLGEKYYRHLGNLFIGMAGSFDEAAELAGGIIARALYETGKPDVRAYLKAAMKEVRDG